MMILKCAKCGVIQYRGDLQASDACNACGFRGLSSSGKLLIREFPDPPAPVPPRARKARPAILINCTDDERERWHTKAAARGKSLSEIVRAYLESL